MKLKLLSVCIAYTIFNNYSYALDCSDANICTDASSTIYNVVASGANTEINLTNNDVTIIHSKSGKEAISATSNASITFAGNATIPATNSNGEIFNKYTVRASGGGSIIVNGNFTVEGKPISAAYAMINLNSGDLTVNGDVDWTTMEGANGGGTAYLGGNSHFTVQGKATIHNLSSSTGLMNISAVGNSVSNLNDIDFQSNNHFVFNAGEDATFVAKGTSTIINNSFGGDGIWLGGNALVSLGNDQSVVDNMIANRSGISQLNIGENVNISVKSGEAISVLSNSANSTTTVKGTVTATDISGYSYRVSSLNKNDHALYVAGGNMTGNVLFFKGNDTFKIDSGSLNGNLTMGAGNDTLFVLGGLIEGDISLGAGDDHAKLSGGSINGSISMETGHDTALITGDFDTTGLIIFDGGADGSSVDDTGALTIDGYSLSAYTNVDESQSDPGVNLVNWTEINVNNNSTLTLTGTSLFAVTDTPVISNTLNIDATSTVIGASNVQGQIIVADVNNAGILRFDGNEIAGDIWEIHGNYTGNDGTIVFDTQLGDDMSPTDFLHITGNASGTTGVQVINRGGLGALTTGNGIQLIQVDGTSSANNFSLKSDYQFEGQNAVVGGAYAYSLYAGNQAGNFSGDWYLRSLATKTPPVNPTDPTNPVTPENPTNPVFPTNPIVPSNPVYQPGIALYEVYPQVLQQMNKLGTLEQRVGNRTWLGQHENGVDAASVTEGRGFWMKVEGSTSHINSNKSKTSANYDLIIVKTQLGLDFEALKNDKGTLIGGVYFQYGHAKADISSRFGKGDIKTNGYGLGGTLTWYGNNGLYVDGVAQAMWYKSDINSDTLDRREADGNKGTGYALSIEAGKKIALNQEWTLTPQAQLSYNSVNFDSFRDAYKARVSREDGDALTGRLGVSLDRETAWKSAAGDMRRLKAYGIANLYYEFLDGTQVQVTGVKFRNQPDRFWGGLGAGLSHNWGDDKYSIYGEVDARSSFNDFGDSYSLNGTVGFRAKF